MDAAESLSSSTDSFKCCILSCRFIIVAPDSKNKLVWAQRSAKQSFSGDWEHVQVNFDFAEIIKCALICWGL